LFNKDKKKNKCHAISLPIQSCLWKRAKMMKDSMNKMIKRIKDDSDMFVFWWIRKKETKKKWYKSLYERLRKMFVFMMIFFRKDEIICTEKNIIAFWMTALLAWVQGGGTNH